MRPWRNMATLVSDAKVPRWFVRRYLSLKGYRDLEALGCKTCEMMYFGSAGEWDDNVEEQQAAKHPIRFLWEHAQQGHQAQVMVTHYWGWTTGHPDYPLDRVDWGAFRSRWYEWAASADADIPETGQFKLIEEYEEQDCA